MFLFVAKSGNNKNLIEISGFFNMFVPENKIIVSF